ncbi:hypothetical protein EC988_003886, partial [Linderina pennispora]
GWDPSGGHWQVSGFDSIDAIPQRPQIPSPRHGSQEILPEAWIAKRQRQCPATVLSLHTLSDDALLGEELARNRICLAARQLTYTAVVVVSRAMEEQGDAQARVSGLVQKSGVQVMVCWPGSAQQFQQFLAELAARLQGMAGKHYCELFARAQRKATMVMMELPEAIDGVVKEEPREGLVMERFRQFLPVRAWAARYYAKMMLFAECFGDRVIATKCLWVAYANLAVFACGLVQGRYAGDGQAAEGELWENAKALLEALNARLLRYWLYGPPPTTVRMPGTDIPDLPGDPHIWWPLGGVLGAQPDTSRSVCLAKAARQASEHSRLLQDGWAGRQYEIQAVLHQVAEKNGVRFASPDVWPESPAVLFSLAARARLERRQGQAALELLEKALLCLDGKIDLSAEQLVVAAGAKRGHLFLMLLSEVGQALVMLDRPADALGVFVAVAAQFRRQGWAELTCHALRWVAKCAETTNDAEQCARAALELMVLDKAQCGRQLVEAAGRLDHLVSVGMCQVFAPITCHAHLLACQTDSRTLPLKYQVVLDCYGLTEPLQLTELRIEFSSHHVHVRHAAENKPAAALANVRFAELASTAADCDLLLVPGTSVVLEGQVEIESDTRDSLVLEAVSAMVGENLRLFWQTSCEQSLAAADEALTEVERRVLESSAAEVMLGVPKNRRWLHVQSNPARWLALPESPTSTLYSRCRQVQLPPVPPSVSLTIPSVAQLAPAYQGEKFPVDIVIRNLHKTQSLQHAQVTVMLVDQPEGNAEAKLIHAQETGMQLEFEVAGIAPAQEHVETVFVDFAAPSLMRAWQGSPAAAVLVRCSAECVFQDLDQPLQVSAQATVPVTRPLRALVEAQPMQPASVGEPGGRCFRRTLHVTLENTGPWAVQIDRISVQPPGMDSPVRVALAATSSVSNVEVPGNGQITCLVHLDLFAKDLVRVPELICPGILEVQWRRALPAGLSPQTTLLWLRPLALVQRRVQLESQCSASVARVGQPLQITYQVVNMTRALAMLELSMHASEGFVFAGPRRTTLNVMPGDTATVAYTVMPISAIMQGQGRAPGQAAISEDMGRVGCGWMQLPRLD